MPAGPTTKSPPANPDKAAASNVNPHRPEMPQIPGVSEDRLLSPKGLDGLDLQRLLEKGAIFAAVLLIGVAIFWWAKAKTRTDTATSTDPEPAEQRTPALPAPRAPAATAPDGTSLAATADELSKPWASKKFTFMKPFINENIPAMVIRLPGGELWAFSLQEPYGRCELEYVTDLDRLASQYGFHSTHPMVGNPCNGAVYDPLKVGPLGGNTWVRGEIVKGDGLRPPISINVTESGQSIIADRIE